MVEGCCGYIIFFERVEMKIPEDKKPPQCMVQYRPRRLTAILCRIANESPEHAKEVEEALRDE